MNISSNVRKLMRVFVILFIALSGSLVYWQAIAAEQVTSNPHNARKCLLQNVPVRGRIFDRNGVLLAESVKDPKASCGYVRHYTESSLAGLIGYYAYGYLSTGLEARYDDILMGQTDKTALDNLVNETLHRPPVGNDIYLTIDVRIQKVINEAFDYQSQDPAKFNKGAIVVANPHTGEVLGMLSRPGFDPNQMAKSLAYNKLDYYNQVNADKSKPLLFRPTRELYSPGSTYKTMTLLGALDSGTTKLDTQWKKEDALKVTVDGFPITVNNIDSFTERYPVSTEYNFENSNNVVFARLGMAMGSETWLKYNDRLYLGKDFPFDLPVVQSKVLPADSNELTKVQLASSSFGQGTTVVTPLQNSLIANAVANDGKLMQPYLVSKITDKDKNTLRTISPKQLSDVASAQAASQVRRAMFAVAKCGSGVNLPVWNTSPWGIVGKTGTAQVDDSGNILAHSWLQTMGPYYPDDPSKQPAITVTIMKENSGEAIYNVGPAMTKIYEDIFTNKYVGDVQAPNPPPANTYCPANQLWR